MTLLEFMQFYMYFLVAGTLAVTGWYFITRGEKETMPDGRIHKKGKVFRDWYFFWTKTRGLKKVFYKGSELDLLWSRYKMEYGEENPFNFSPDYNSWIVPVTTENSNYLLHNIRGLEERLQVRAEIRKNVVSFYKEYDDFVFPAWVRDPLAQCATCFSSVYGSIFYWGVICLGNNKNYIFAWTEYVLLAKICFWIAFCFSLAVLNTALAKKFN